MSAGPSPSGGPDGVAGDGHRPGAAPRAPHGSPRVVTVTLNPAEDVTYTVPRTIPGAVHAVGSVERRPGGKGLNVARVLAAIGASPLATGLLGGRTGAAVRELLDDLGVAHAFEPVTEETRRTVTVVDGTTATAFNEPGPTVTATEWAAFRRRFAGLLGGAAAVALSGSLPPGLPDDAYHRLLVAAREAGIRTAVDTSGRGLAPALDAGPDLVKVNHLEAAEVVGTEEPLEAARRLHERTGGVAAVSAGADGLAVWSEASRFVVVPPAVEAVNPTGAGDTVLATLVLTALTGASLEEQAIRAVALAATTVTMPTAGTVDLDAAAPLAAHVVLRRPTT